MPSKLDDKTMVPLGVVTLVLVFMGSGIWAAAGWVKGVQDELHQFNGRVARVERALHIEPPSEDVALEEPNPFVNQAEAGSRIFQPREAARRGKNGTGR